MPRKRLTYRSAGVSIAANEELVRRIRRCLLKTQDSRVLSDINGFAGFFRLKGERQKFKDPVLVGCSDGVGSKVLLSIKAGNVKTVGIDLVAMNVNDLVTCGAQPLFFLDYVAVHKNTPSLTAEIVEGIADGCVEAGCALLGGETAEMPEIYRKGDFDLAGFALGVVEHKNLIAGQKIKPGDVMIGLASSGIHSNGYALVRRLFFEVGEYKLTSKIKGLRHPLGTELLKPTRIYVKPILSLLDKHSRIIKGMAHITGGGLPGNVPRVLPKGCRAIIEKGSWRMPPIFQIMQSMGVVEKEMYHVFNMGIGMVLIVRRKDAPVVLNHFSRRKLPAYTIGKIVKGRRGLVLA